ncbi:MAG: acyltransferase family protein [Actinobacteria bacterium]|nr:acyltransferase family protein [Actinomycetota bacterium]
MPEARIIPIAGNEPSAQGGVTPLRGGTEHTPKDAPRLKAGGGSARTKPRAKRPEPEAEAEVESPAESFAPLPGSDYEQPDWDERVARGLRFLRRRVTGDYEIDDFGFDPELTDKVLMEPFRPLYEKWFRVETRGLENVPDTGGALVVANHSGTVAIDSVMTQVALLDHHPARRHLRMLGADLVFQTPFVGEYARKSGSTLASSSDAQALLTGGELVGVWPEGFKGVGKPYSERYKLQRFGRGGFVAAALHARVPIIPTAIVGAEEIYPMLGDARTLARLLGLPYFPLTPTFPWLGPLGMIPLPSKWIIMFGEPIHTEDFPEGSEEDPMLVFNLTDQVRETIQQQLYRVLVQRRSIFF